MTSINFRPAPAPSTTSRTRPAASTSVQHVANFGSFGIGDNVEAIGSVTQFNGLTELHGHQRDAARLGTAAGAAAHHAVAARRRRRRRGARRTADSRRQRHDHRAARSGDGGTTSNVTITDATGTGVMRIDGDTNIDGTPTPAGTFSVIGVASQFDVHAAVRQRLPDPPALASPTSSRRPSCPAIAIGGTLPRRIVGTPYSQTLTASGGTAPYTFTILTGALPAGLSAEQRRRLSGTPTLPGTLERHRPRHREPTAALAPPRSRSSSTGVLTVTRRRSGSDRSRRIDRASSVTHDQHERRRQSRSTRRSRSPAPMRRSSPSAAPAATTLAAGASTTASLTFLPTSAGARRARRSTITSNGGGRRGSLDRHWRGAGRRRRRRDQRNQVPRAAGGNDEFVELYNNSDNAVSIAGWKLMGSSNTAPTGVRATVPANVTLPPRTHYLFVNTAASGYSGTVPGNLRVHHRRLRQRRHRADRRQQQHHRPGRHRHDRHGLP